MDECRVLVNGKHARICPQCVARASMQVAVVLRGMVDKVKAAQKEPPRVVLAGGPMPEVR